MQRRICMENNVIPTLKSTGSWIGFIWRTRASHSWRRIPSCSSDRRFSDPWSMLRSTCNKASRFSHRRKSSADTRVRRAYEDSCSHCRGRISCFACWYRSAVWRPRRSCQKSTIDGECVTRVSLWETRSPSEIASWLPPGERIISCCNIVYYYISFSFISRL